MAPMNKVEINSRLETLRVRSEEIKAELQRRKEELFAEIRERAKEVFPSISAVVFEKFPQLESFGWTQYTPHWNDGDTCVFSARTDSWGIELNGKDGDEDYDEDKATYESHQSIREEIASVLSVFDDDDFELLFGDHVRVTVKREGIDIEEYEHD